MSMGQSPRGKPSQCWIFCKLRLWPTVVSTQFMHVETLYTVFFTPLSVKYLEFPPFPRQAQRFIHEFAKFLTTFGGSQPELCGFPSLSQLLCEKKMNKKMKTKSTKTVKGEDCSTSSRLEGYEIPFFHFRDISQASCRVENYTVWQWLLSILAAKLCKWRSHTLWWVVSLNHGPDRHDSAGVGRYPIFTSHHHHHHHHHHHEQIVNVCIEMLHPGLDTRSVSRGWLCCFWLFQT